MSEPANSNARVPLPEQSIARFVPASQRGRWVALVCFAILWIGFVLIGQVRARFWIQNEFQIEWRSIPGVWRVALGELPGGLAIQALILVSALVIVCGVIGCLYLILIESDHIEDPAPEIS